MRAAWTGLQVTINVTNFKYGFMVSIFIQTEIRNVVPKKLLCFSVFIQNLNLEYLVIKVQVF